jgi:SAM-dependent methyltransferase
MDNFTSGSKASAQPCEQGLRRASDASGRVYDVAKLTGDSRLQSDVLEELTDAHRYRRWLADLARPHLGEHPIEIGSGNGDYALEWAGDVTSFTATEADEDRFARITERFADHPTITTRWLLLGQPASTPAEISATTPTETSTTTSADHTRHSCAIAYNVLEHIPDDVGAIRAMADLLRPGGSVVLVVPAFPSAMSPFDLAIGHQRRYTLASLQAVLAGAGLHVQQIRYVNPIGLVAWYVMVKALGTTPRNSLGLRLYDRTVVPLARFADRWLPTPFGQSVFAVATVPT